MMTSRAIGRFPAQLFDQDTWDIGAINAFLGLSNRIALMSNIRTSDGFSLVGRVPAEK